MSTRTRVARVIDPTIGQNVTRERTAVPMTRDQLAEWMRNRGQTHWQRTTVERVENGQQRIDADELAALVYVLGSDVLLDTPLAEVLQLEPLADADQ